MRGARRGRRLDRITESGPGGAIAQSANLDYLKAVAGWARVLPIEVTTEARRIDALCRVAGAWTVEARLQVAAADGGVSVESLRAELADLPRTLCVTVT